MEKLKKYIQQIRGVSYKPVDSSEKPKEGFIPLLRANNINNGKINFEHLIYVKKEKVKDVQYLKKGDILICTSSGSKELVGKAGLIKKDTNATFGAFCKVIRLKECCNYNYFNHYFQSSYYKSMIQKSSNGANINNLKTKNFEDLNVNMMDYEIQTHIANKLDKVQKIIDLRRTQIDELDELIKSQFVEMFGNLKLNDKGWKNIDKIGNICILNPKKNEIANLDNIEVSFIPMQNVSDKGDINIGETRLLNDVKKGFSYFKENDILFAKITPCMENGKGAIAKGLKNNIGFGSTEFHILRPKNNINSIWLYTLTSLFTFRKEAEMKMTGSAGQKRVPINFFKDYKIGLPPLELQNQFANIVEQINKQKFEIQKSLEETQKLQESLMKQYF